MKVCMVSKHFPPYAGGLEVRVFELSSWLALRGDGVLVLTTHERGTSAHEVVDGVVVERSHSVFNLFNAVFAPGILMDLLAKDYDLIDVNLPDPVGSVFALVASLVRGKPLMVTYHADIIRDGLVYLPFKLVYRPFERLVFRRSSRIFVTSPDYAKTSQELAGYLDKTAVAPSFIDPAKYEASGGGKIRSKLAGGKKYVVLFVGRLVGYKGLEYLIEAAKDVDDAMFVIVGDGPLRESLREKASDMPNILFAGQVTDKALVDYYSACDLLVLPSVTRQEAFGLVLVEAMACGKPVISTNFSGMPYVVGGGGLLVAPRDTRALASAISKVLGDSGLAKELAAKGRRRVKELFSRDAVCAKIRAEYESAVKSARR